MLTDRARIKSCFKYCDLNNKLRHSYVLPISRQLAGLIGAEFFCGQSWVVSECYGLNKIRKIQHFFQTFCFHGQRRALQLVLTKI